jgi:hypothetical protein
MQGNRRLVKEGLLVKISKNKAQERHFFLFNDVLVYTKKSQIGNTFIFRGMIELEK